MNLDVLCGCLIGKTCKSVWNFPSPCPTWALVSVNPGNVDSFSYYIHTGHLVSLVFSRLNWWPFQNLSTTARGFCSSGWCFQVYASWLFSLALFSVQVKTKISSHKQLLAFWSEIPKPCLSLILLPPFTPQILLFLLFTQSTDISWILSQSQILSWAL